MGVILVDLADVQCKLQCNWWSWRPTLALVESTGVISNPERLALLGTNVCAEVTEAEARALAEELGTSVLPRMQTGDRIRLDLSITTEPDDYVFERDPQRQELNYGASFEWLRKLEAFCSVCGGFRVL